MRPPANGDKRKQKIADSLLLRASFSELSDSQNYLFFLIGLLQSSRAVRLWQKYVKYFHRFRFVTTAVRLFPWILLLISTNTLLYAVAAVAVILIPFLLLAVLSLTASALIRYKDTNSRMAKRLTEKTVYVFFPERTKEFADAHFWKANILDLAKSKDNCVIVVSPFFLSPRGLNGQRFYFNVRHEKINVFLVRRHYFFSLRKHVLLPHAKKLILIY